MVARPRIAVVSPFLDKRHGTERCVAEQVERLADDYEFHVYSTRVEDVDLSRITWHRIPNIPGPHLLRYLWWFIANQLWRYAEHRFRGLKYDLLYSPGINCLDADVISVHVVFAGLHRQASTALDSCRNSLPVWSRMVHRRLYYRLAMALERRVYTRKDLPLAVVSRKVAEDLARFYGRHNNLRVIYHGLDLARFNPEGRARLRQAARQALGLPPAAFAVLLIGNDWKKKGLPCLLEAIGRICNPNVWVLVVGEDGPAPYRASLARRDGSVQILFLPVRPDVEFYYAAADAYAGPSLEDAFALPPAEAMACGLPVIVSRQAGVSEVITHGADGLILEDPTDAEGLSQLIRRLYEDPDLRWRLGENAERTARRYTWDRNAEQLKGILQTALEQKCRRQKPEQDESTCERWS